MMADMRTVFIGATATGSWDFVHERTKPKSLKYLAGMAVRDPLPHQWVKWVKKEEERTGCGNNLFIDFNDSMPAALQLMRQLPITKYAGGKQMQIRAIVDSEECSN